MREIFLGDLTKLKLFDILKTVLVEKKTGALVINGKEIGEIYLEDGDIIHAQIAHVAGEEAFMSIMAWRVGKINFIPDMAAKEKTIAISAEQLLLKWSYRKQEWEKIREVIPSPLALFRLPLQQNPAEKNIRGDQWNILALANGLRTVSEIAEAVAWDEFKTSKVICQLVQAGLLEKGEEQKAIRKKRVSDTFFPTVEYELKKVMGPVAPFLIEDKLSELGERKEFFPQDRAALFIEALGEEITNEQKRKSFIKTMMTEIL